MHMHGALALINCISYTHTHAHTHDAVYAIELNAFICN